ncbi:MAG: outer membrane protein assembly factor BamD [Rhodocyclaceae bacterium]
MLGGCGVFGEPKDETAGWSAQKLYTEAKSLMAEGSYEKAVKLFETLEARYPFGRYAQQAQLEIAYSYYRNNDRASAVAACDRFIKLHPNHPNVDYAYYLKGLALFHDDAGLLGFLAPQDPSERDSKAARESFEVLRELVVRFPSSRYARDAQARAGYLVNAMASYEVAVANYYLRRGAHVAAVNRAQAAVKQFPEAPATEKALFILVKSYDAMGLDDLRDDAERVMRRNFPNSPYYARGIEGGRPWWKFW